jgi:hypothetical protein
VGGRGTHGRSATGVLVILERPQAPARLDLTVGPPGAFTPDPHLFRGSGARALLFHQAQRGMSSLWLGCWRGEEDSGFEQKLAYLIPYTIADPGGGYIPCEQLDGMWPRPFSLLIGALTA